jgi:Uma2 family endonuclease
MAVSTQRKRSALSIEAFRAFYASRPDEEHWELIDGVPMMMAPATFIHQRIASNLERLLNDALARQDVHNVRVDGRSGESWQVDVLDKVNDVLTLPAFGLRCAVGDLYRGTPLAP